MTLTHPRDLATLGQRLAPESKAAILQPNKTLENGCCLVSQSEFLSLDYWSVEGVHHLVAASRITSVVGS